MIDFGGNVGEAGVVRIPQIRYTMPLAPWGIGGALSVSAETPETAPAPTLRSSILEHRFALFDEGGHAFVGILGLEGEGREVGLDLEAVVQAADHGRGGSRRAPGTGPAG